VPRGVHAPGTGGGHAFTFGGARYAFDPVSGALHRLSAPAYTAVRLVAARGWDGARAGRGGRDEQTAHRARLLQSLDELAQLQAAGALFTADPAPGVGPAAGASSGAGVARDPGAGRMLRALCLNVAHDCNMACDYCFSGDGAYGGGRALMPPDVAERAIDLLFDCAGGPACEVDFFGGEPLLNLEAVAAAVARGRQRARERGMRVAFTLTTNALLLRGEAAGFVDAEMDNVVLSCDGRPVVHDRHRRRRAGGPTHAAVLENVLDFAARRGARDYWVRGTYTRQNLDFDADALYLADRGLPHVSVEPIVAPRRTPLALRRADMPAVRRAYARLAAAVIERRRAGRAFEFFHFRFDRDRGACLERRAAGGGGGRDYLAVDPSGRLWPCHQFVGRPGFELGDVRAGIAASPVRAAFCALGVAAKPACRQCWARYLCGGGCHAAAHLASGDLLTPDPVACAVQRARLEAALHVAADTHGSTTQRL